MPPAKYRVRGLPAIETQPVSPAEPDSKPNALQPPLEAGYRAGDVPCLSDYLDGAHIWGMQRYWPSCDFLHRAPGARPIKHLPLALAEYLTPAEGDTSLLARITAEWERIQAEELAVGRLRATLDAGDDFSSIRVPVPPVAAAFGAYLFRSSPRWIDRRDTVLEIICERPEAAWLALLSGAWCHHTEPLLKALAPAPELALQAWQHSVFSGFVPEPLFALMPWLYFSSRFKHAGVVPAQATAPGESAPSILWQRMIESVRSEPRSAAFALGLKPDHPEAEVWTRLIRKNLAAMYWAVRVGSARIEPSELPYWKSFRAFVRSVPRWGYHWVRDFEPGTAYEFVEGHWPHPWAIELAVDLKLQKSAVHQVYEQKPPLEQQNPLGDAVTLWVSDYLLSKGKEDNEED